MLLPQAGEADPSAGTGTAAVAGLERALRQLQQKARDAAEQGALQRERGAAAAEQAQRLLGENAWLREQVRRHR